MKLHRHQTYIFFSGFIKKSQHSPPEELVPNPADILPAVGEAPGERPLSPQARRLRQLHEKERPRHVHLRLHHRRRLRGPSRGGQVSLPAAQRLHRVQALRGRGRDRGRPLHGLGLPRHNPNHGPGQPQAQYCRHALPRDLAPREPDGDSLGVRRHDQRLHRCQQGRRDRQRSGRVARGVPEAVRHH